MANADSRRFVMAVPPTRLSAIGDTLRKAFARPATPPIFERLIERLNRLK